MCWFFYYSSKFSSNNGFFTDHSRMYPTITTKLLTAGPHWELWEMEVSMLVGDHQDLKRYSECPLSIQIVGNSVFHVHLKLPLMESTDTSIPYPCKVCHVIFNDSIPREHKLYYQWRLAEIFIGKLFSSGNNLKVPNLIYMGANGGLPKCTLTADPSKASCNSRYGKIW